MYEPAPHMVRTERQASALSFGEKEEPTKQAAHWRSSVAEPAWDCPVLIAHVRHAVHAWFPELLLKKPESQSVHVRSLLSVAALFMYCPGPHTERMLLHAEPLAVSEKVTSSSHAMHWRSAAAEPGLDMPSPFGHVRQAVQASLPTLFLK
jgi:hypothetical protein